MSGIQGTYHEGHVELDSPVNWPEGARVAVIPTASEIVLTDHDWPQTPNDLKELLACIDALEPLVLTPQDESEIASAREASRQKSSDAVRKQMGLKT